MKSQAVKLLVYIQRRFHHNAQRLGYRFAYAFQHAFPGLQDAASAYHAESVVQAHHVAAAEKRDVRSEDIFIQTDLARLNILTRLFGLIDLIDLHTPSVIS